MLVEFVLLVSCIFAYLYWKDNYSVPNRPPGPTRLPIIGNLHQIALTGKKLPFEAFDILSKTYGPVFSIKMGMKEAVVITSFEDMASLLARDETSGRVLEEFIADRSFKEELGVLFSNGEMWKSVRRFTIRTLRDFGFGRKSTLESMMSEELRQFMDKIKTDVKASGNSSVYVYLFFNLSLVNVLWSMVAGKTFSYDDERLNKFIEMTESMFKAGNFGADISVAFPFLRHMFPNATNANLLTAGFTEFHNFFREIVAEHKARPDYATNPENFVDIFLAKIDEMDETNPSEGFYTPAQLLIVMMDLFMTGTETLSGVLSFGLLFMILNPEVQAKVQKEIDEVVPHGEEVLFEHKPKMIYVQATIMEILRLGNIVPVIPPRKVMQEFTYKGYTFAKDTTIIPNLHSVFVSEKYWDDPKAFRPERFIDSKGELCNMSAFSPFGFGKRFCLGETQATPAIFLYFTTLLQHFEFSKMENQPDPTTDPSPGFTLTPMPFHMKVKVRN